MDKYLEEKNSLCHLLVLGTLSPRDGEVETIIKRAEENLGHMCGNKECDELCECLKDGKDGLKIGLEDLIRDGGKAEK
jgi:hypothetical protein